MSQSLTVDGQVVGSDCPAFKPVLPPSVQDPNHVPLPNEVLNTRKLIDRYHENFAATVTINEQLLQMIEQNEQVMSELSSHVMQMKQFISPIRRLPNETLVEIFFLAIETAEAHPLVDNRCGPGAVLKERLECVECRGRLSLVCSHWNSVISSSPKLWSQIIISPFPTKRGEIPIAVSGDWIKRSRSFPLAVTISLGLYSEPDPKVAKMLYKIIKDSSWRSLELLEFSAMEDVLGPLIKHDLSRLSSFTIMTPLSLTHPVHLEAPSFSLSMPNLTELNVPWHFFDSSSPIFEKVETLCLSGGQTIQSRTLTHILQTLARCPSLQDLTLRYGSHLGTLDISASVPTTIPIPTLKKLTIIRDVAIECLFERLFIPNLQHLHISSLQHVREGSLSRALRLLITKSHPRLLSLKLHRLRVSQGKLLWVLDRLEALRELEVSSYGYKIGAKAIDVLTCRGGRRGVLCPRLESLTLDLVDDTEDNQIAMTRLCGVRGKNPSRTSTPHDPWIKNIVFNNEVQLHHEETGWSNSDSCDCDMCEGF